jgi:very-short-patch-repair endonuclease
MNTMHREKAPRWRASKEMQVRAKQLRRTMTPAERKLWQHLRNGQLNGAWFRRQHAVGPYVVDFFCAKAKLVVEVDGDVHADPAQAEYDAERTEWLNEQKQYRVIRLTNDEVHRNMEGVLAKIFEALSTLSSTTSGQPSR